MLEDFEDGWNNWQSVPTDQETTWKRVTCNDDDYFPPGCIGVNSNFKMVYKKALQTPVTRTLEYLKPINLKNSKKPQLVFYHTQAQYFIGQDELYILIKVGKNSPWDTLDYFTENIESWTRRYYNLNEIKNGKYLKDNVYIAFSGVAKGGHGIQLDSIYIIEKDTITKYLNIINLFSPTNAIIPSGINDIPVLCVELEVWGNQGNSILNEIKFTSLCSDNSIFKNNGFELILTDKPRFRNTKDGNSLKIGTPQNIVNGKITFALNTELKSGYNYLWLVADIKEDAPYGSKIKFKLEKNDIKFNNKPYPSNDIIQDTSYKVEESVFFDDFEENKGWVLQGDFEINIPKGFTTDGSQKDPDFAFSGLKCLGTDLTIDGKYPPNLTIPYYATTPAINLKYYNNVKIYAKKWISFEANDIASIEISNDNGNSWNRIWYSPIDGLSQESDWNDLYIEDKNKILERKENVIIRIGMLSTDDAISYGGWNIDNFAVTGLYLTKDLAITKIIQPWDDCEGSIYDTVKVVIKNLGANPSPPNVPIYYSLFGPDTTLKIYSTITQSINSYDSIVFEFPQLISYPKAGMFDKFIVKVELNGDQDPTNDYIIKPLFIQESLNYPHEQKFETEAGYWKAKPGSTWECKIPDWAIPILPNSPYSWILSPYGDYSNNDTSWIESSCYDLTSNDSLIIELKYWSQSESGVDGANLQYSIDNGNTWKLLNKNHRQELNNYWKWYKNNVSALGEIGWSGISDGWVTAKNLIPKKLLNEPNVKFRIKWASDSENNFAKGFAIDDFKIYPAPPDIGPVEITYPQNACLNINPSHVTLKLKNFGFNALNENDTIVAGYLLDNSTEVIDTFIIKNKWLPGSEIYITFKDTIKLPFAKTYNIKAFVLEKFPMFYPYRNDTIEKNFNILPLPIIGLPDTIQSKRPDTVVLRPYKNPNYSYLWSDGSTADTFKVPRPGTYYLTVTDVGGNGCSAYDSVYVELLFYDVGVDSLIWPINSCELSKEENITLLLRNFGTDSIESGTPIPLGYIINNNSPVYEVLTLEKNFLRNGKIPFTFKAHTFDFSQPGEYTIKIFSAFGADTISDNDTLIKVINVYGYPVVDIGPDTLVVQNVQYTLDAGPGFISYLWDNGDTSRKRTIYYSGSYNVLVHDIHNCPARDTIYVFLKIRDVRPSMLIEPLSSCNRTGTSKVVLQIRNSGSDTIPAGSLIIAKYAINNSEMHMESFTLPSNLYPGNTINRTFAPDVDLTSTGDYIFTLYATTNSDMRKWNDTLYDTIYTYPAPVVDFKLPNPYVTEELQVILDPGYNEHYTYLWQDGSTTNTYTVTSDKTYGTYKVKVTDRRTNCYSEGSITVSFLIYDVGIYSSNIPSNLTCSQDFKNFNITLRNFGNVTLTEGTTVYIIADVNNQIVARDTFVLTGLWSFGSNRNHIFDKKISITPPSSILKLYTMMNKDKYYKNDTLKYVYNEIKQSPVVDFGDIDGLLRIQSFPYTLDAGEGYVSYLWNDGSTNRFFTVETAGNYSVTVTADNGCITQKSVRVVLTSIPEHLSDKIQILPNPASDKIIIRTKGINNNFIINIFNSSGVLINSYKILSDNQEIDIEKLLPGIYFIKGIIDNEVFTYKIIVSK